MKLFLRFSLCLLVLSCITGASSLYTFTYTGTGDYAGDSATALLTANSNGNGTFTVISGSGFWDGTIPIDLYLNPIAPGPEYSTDGRFIYDDQLFPGINPVITNPGLMFNIALGSATELNIWSLGPGQYEAMMYGGDSYSGTSFGRASLAEAPEPTTLPLVLIGIIGIGFGRYPRWRRR
jgi:hypothetical protein